MSEQGVWFALARHISPIGGGIPPGLPHAVDVAVVEEEQTFDLIELIDVTEFLGETELTSGKYTQIRLLVSSINLEVDGEPVTLKVPSNKIKLVKPFTISTNKTTTLTLDFDAEESVHQAGSKYILKPTIKVIQE